MQIYVDNLLHVGIFALEDIGADAELVVDLDPNWKQSNFIPECICNSITCPVYFFYLLHHSYLNSKSRMDFQPQNQRTKTALFDRCRRKQKETSSSFIRRRDQEKKSRQSCSSRILSYYSFSSEYVQRRKKDRCSHEKFSADGKQTE